MAFSSLECVEMLELAPAALICFPESTGRRLFVVTVLCKSNDNDNRQILRFVLPICRRYLCDISRILATR